MAVGSQFPKGIGTLQNPGSFELIIDKIKQICENYEVETIVVGTPVRDNTQKETLMSEIERFAAELEESIGIKIVFEPEAYTSVQAEAELKSRGINPSREKDKVDELAAILILEQFINK